MSGEAEQAPGLPVWKRATDVLLAGVGLVVLSPLLALVALLVKLTSPGPVLFSQERCGLGGRRFRILKFRKMAATVSGGARVTGRHDYRMTGLGRVLERTKLDELPQLWNVLKGDMSVVGPRPEDPVFVDRYPEEFARILTTPPGLAGPNQIQFRNESELYPKDCSDSGEFYVQEILPQKIPSDIAYAERERGFFRDLVLLARVLLVTLFGVLPLATVKRQPVILLHLLVVPVLVATALTISFLLHFDFTIPPAEEASYVFLMAVLVPAQTLCFFAFSNHNVVGKYFNVLDLKDILKASFLGTAVALVASLAVQFTSHSRVVLVLHTFLLVILGVFWMSSFRQLPHWWTRTRGDHIRRLRITVAYSLLGGVAFSLAYALRFGWELNIFEPYALGWIVLAVVLTNGLVFFVMQGWGSLNRVISFGHHYEILKVTLVCSAAIYAVAFLSDVERSYPRSLLVMEAIFKYSLALMLKYTLARWYARDDTHGERSLRVLLVGTLEEVDQWFRAPPTRLEGTPSLDVVGILLLEGYYEGMSIHSRPILGEVSQAAEIVEQLDIQRVVVLAPACKPLLLDQGIAGSMLAQAG